MTAPREVAVLFAREDSVYKALPGCDVWDQARDARRWPGGCPVVAHPPCRLWGKLRGFAKPDEGERELAPWAVEQVRRFGGVLEHPSQSLLWKVCGLPEPGQRDRWGGWTLPVTQNWFGHRALKPTRLYVVGCAPGSIPPIPFFLGEPTHVIQTRSHGRVRLKKGDLGWKPEVSKAEREQTPSAMAAWLVELARRTEKT